MRRLPLARCLPDHRPRGRSLSGERTLAHPSVA